MADDLAKLKVVITADSGKMKKEMDKSRQEVKKSVSAIRQETAKLKNPFQNFSSTKAVQSIRSATAKIKSALSGISPKQSIKDFQIKAGIKVDTEEFKQVKADIENAEQTLNRYYERRDKMEYLGTDKESNAWKGLEYDINNAEAALNRYEKRKASMEASGTDVARPVSIPRQALGLGKGVLGGVKNGISGISTGISKGWGGITKLFSGVGSAVGKVTAIIGKASGAFGALIQKFTSGIPLLNRTKNSMNGLGNSGRGLSGIFRTLGMTAKFMLASFVISGAVNGAKEGFQNLAQYSSETNRSISTLMSSLTQLKNSLAAAFAPILNVITPILNAFIQKIISVVNAIGQLMSAITGKGTFVKAKKVQQDYAASLNDNASSAADAQKANEDLQRTILGFDQINKLDSSNSSNNGSGSGSGGTTGGLNPSDMFETVQIGSKYKDLAKQLKDAWKNADFTEIGTMVARKLNSALKNIPWDNIKATCDKIAKSVATFLNGFIETADWNLVGDTVSQGVNTAFEAANTFAQNFHWDSLGTAVGNGINGAMNGLDWSLIHGTVRNVVSGLMDSVNTFIRTANWNKVGSTIGNYMNAKLYAVKTAVQQFDWKETGKAFATGMNSWINTYDFAAHGKALSDGIKGVLDTLIVAIENTDWKQLGEKFKEGLENIDWNGIFDRFSELLGAAFGGLAAFLGGLIGDGVTAAKKYFQDKIEECGGDIPAGILKGIVDGIAGIGDWIKEHIFDPFMEGFKKAFGIHSPSTVMAEQGGYIIDGLLEGMKANIGALLSWVGELPGKVKDGLGDAKEWLKEKGQGAMSGLQNGWEAVKSSTLGQTAGKIGSQIKEKAGDAKAWIKQKGTDAITGIKNGWEQAKQTGFLSYVAKIGNEAYQKIGNIKDKVLPKGKDIVTGLKEGFNNNWSSFSTTLGNLGSRISKAIPNLWNTGRNAIVNFANGFSSVHIPLPHISISWNSHSVGPLSFSTPSFGLSWYAKGGFPQNGEMFIANEAGPEMVGKMGNRNTVANNNQIVEGIKNGVFEAVLDAFQASGILNGGSSDKNPVIEFTFKVDNETFYKIVRKGESKYNSRYEVTATM